MSYYLARLNHIRSIDLQWHNNECSNDVSCTAELLNGSILPLPSIVRGSGSVIALPNTDAFPQFLHAISFRRVLFRHPLLEESTIDLTRYRVEGASHVQSFDKVCICLNTRSRRALEWVAFATYERVRCLLSAVPVGASGKVLTKCICGFLSIRSGTWRCQWLKLHNGLSIDEQLPGRHVVLECGTETESILNDQSHSSLVSKGMRID
jgi:hypothetical protein